MTANPDVREFARRVQRLAAELAAELAASADLLRAALNRSRPL